MDKCVTYVSTQRLKKCNIEMGSMEGGEINRKLIACYCATQVDPDGVSTGLCEGSNNLP